MSFAKDTLSSPMTRSQEFRVIAELKLTGLMEAPVIIVMDASFLLHQLLSIYKIVTIILQCASRLDYNCGWKYSVHCN